MSNYQRVYQQGGCYFFTVVTHNRKPVLTEDGIIDRLRAAFSHVAESRPFTVVGAVVLPDHLHCLWQLPEDDADFSTRWRLIKHYVSIAAKRSGNQRCEKRFWQRRFWEHLIRDESDWRRHLDYIHYNPVKHGYVDSPGKWPNGTFHRYVRKGWYPSDWGAFAPESLRDMELG